MTRSVDLQAGARARLEAVQTRLAEVRSAIAAHERSIAELRTLLPDLEFEEEAMRYIVGGSSPAAAAAPRIKLTRQEVVEAIRDHLVTEGRPLSVADLHRHLVEDRGVDLGANARNYLCGVLSRGKGTIFENVDKGAWWLAGHPAPLK